MRRKKTRWQTVVCRIVVWREGTHRDILDAVFLDVSSGLFQCLPPIDVRVIQDIDSPAGTAGQLVEKRNVVWERRKPGPDLPCEEYDENALANTICPIIGCYAADPDK